MAGTVLKDIALDLGAAVTMSNAVHMCLSEWAGRDDWRRSPQQRTKVGHEGLDRLNNMVNAVQAVFIRLAAEVDKPATLAPVGEVYPVGDRHSVYLAHEEAVLAVNAARPELVRLDGDGQAWATEAYARLVSSIPRLVRVRDVLAVTLGTDAEFWRHHVVAGLARPGQSVVHPGGDDQAPVLDLLQISEPDAEDLVWLHAVQATIRVSADYPLELHTAEDADLEQALTIEESERIRSETNSDQL
ncbi:hypothetical protein D5S17_29055 [Pseudonocardiaceae bacterium YIM PH 21723]|nr:hypothetical protein D5S17_29055 [Pseudonocardiaceae bacterium YIM PH 21723]